MADFRIDVSVSDKGATGTVQKIDGQFGNLRGTVSGVGAEFKKLGVSTADLDKIGKSLSLSVTAPLALAAGASVKFSNDFNKGMANIATLIPGNTARVKELGESVRQVAVTTGKSTTDISAGLYQVVSAFGDSSDSAKILDINARAAAAGLATTEDAINLTSSVTKGYGDTSAEAVQQVADLAFQTVKLGQTTFPELAASMGRVVPVAATLGASQEELFGIMATLTGVTGNAAEVTTQVNAAMTALIKPTTEAQAAMKELGFENAETLVQSKGLVGALNALMSTTDGTTTEVGKLFGQTESLRAVFALTGAQAETFAEKHEAMTVAAGSAETAFAEVTEGVNKNGFALEQAGVKMEIAAQKAGEVLAPVLVGLLDVVIPLIDKFIELDPVAQQVIVGIAGIAAAIGPVLIAISSLTKAWAVLGPVLAGAAGPVGWAVAIAAAITAIGAFIAANDTLRAVVVTVWGEITGAVQGAITFFGPLIDVLSDGLASAGERAGAVFSSLGAMFDPVVQKAGELAGAFAPVIEKTEELVSVLQDKFGPILQSGLAIALSVAGAALGEFVDRVARGAEIIANIAVPAIVAYIEQLIRGATIISNVVVRAFDQLIHGATIINSVLLQIPGVGDAVAAALNRMAGSTEEMRKAAAEAGPKIDELTGGTEEMEKAARDAKPKIDELTRSVKVSAEEMKKAAKQGQDWGEAMRTVNDNELFRLKQSIKNDLTPALREAGHEVPVLKATIEDLSGILPTASFEVDSLRRRLEEFGIQAAGTTSEQIEKLQEKLQLLWQAAGVVISWEQARVEINKTNAEIIRLGGGAEETKKKIDEVPKSIQQVSTAITDLGRNIASDIIHVRSFSDALDVVKNAAIGVGETILRTLIETALDPLINKLKEVLLPLLGDVLEKLGKVFGIGGGGSGVFNAGTLGPSPTGGSVPQIPGGDVAGTAGTAVGTGASAVVGMVTGIVSAVSGVISNFQFAGMNKSLDLIVNHTLRMFNVAKQDLDDNQYRIAENSDYITGNTDQMKVTLWEINAKMGFQVASLDTVKGQLAAIISVLGGQQPVALTNDSAKKVGEEVADAIDKHETTRSARGRVGRQPATADEVDRATRSPRGRGTDSVPTRESMEASTRAGRTPRGRVALDQTSQREAAAEAARVAADPLRAFSESGRKVQRAIEDSVDKQEEVESEMLANWRKLREFAVQVQAGQTGRLGTGGIATAETLQLLGGLTTLATDRNALLAELNANQLESTKATTTQLLSLNETSTSLLMLAEKQVDQTTLLVNLSTLIEQNTALLAKPLTVRLLNSSVTAAGLAGDSSIPPSGGGGLNINSSAAGFALGASVPEFSTHSGVGALPGGGAVPQAGFPLRNASGTAADVFGVRSPVLQRVRDIAPQINRNLLFRSPGGRIGLGDTIQRDANRVNRAGGQQFTFTANVTVNANGASADDAKTIADVVSREIQKGGDRFLRNALAPAVKATINRNIGGVRDSLR